MNVQCPHCKKRFDVTINGRETNAAGLTVGSKGDFIYCLIADAGKAGVTERDVLLKVLEKWDKGLGRMNMVVSRLRRDGVIQKTADGKIRLTDSYLQKVAAPTSPKK